MGCETVTSTQPTQTLKKDFAGSGQNATISPSKKVQKNRMLSDMLLLYNDDDNKLKPPAQKMIKVKSTKKMGSNPEILNVKQLKQLKEGKQTKQLAEIKQIKQRKEARQVKEIRESLVSKMRTSKLSATQKGENTNKQ